MKRVFVLIASLIFFSVFIQNTNSELQYTVKEFAGDADQTVSLIFAGDIMGHSPQFQAAYHPIDKTYHYDICFRHVKTHIESADFAIANLEVTLAGAPYSGYPNFSSPDALLDGMKNAGYDVILTANNHIVDRGKKGLERTNTIINNRQLKQAGSYLNIAQRDSIYPLFIEQKGVKIALLNCTYGTNGIAVSEPNMVNMLDTVQIKEDICKAKSRDADLIFMTVHWGAEYMTKANDEQRKLAHFFVRQGVNLVIGSHPHVVQNAEILYNIDSIAVPVFYSLGNSISNQRKPDTDGGIMVKVEIGTQSKQILETSYLPVYVHKGVLDNVYQYHLIPTTDFVNDPSRFMLNKTDSAALMYFDNETRKRLNNIKIF
ncbi:MAG: CapA family protein [Paludibacter sp.]|nr:CapA family protein [Paludibacter sp.]